MPRTLAWIARTRAVAASASSRGPQATRSMTCAVRRRRAYGSSSEPVWAKKPANATGCAACMSSVRGAENATTVSRITRRSIESSVK